MRRGGPGDGMDPGRPHSKRRGRAKGRTRADVEADLTAERRGFGAKGLGPSGGLTILAYMNPSSAETTAACAECGTTRPLDIANASPRPPCPDCGATAV